MRRHRYGALQKRKRLICAHFPSGFKDRAHSLEGKLFHELLDLSILLHTLLFSETLFPLCKSRFFGFNSLPLTFNFGIHSFLHMQLEEP